MTGLAPPQVTDAWDRALDEEDTWRDGYAARAPGGGVRGAQAAAAEPCTLPRGPGRSLDPAARRLRSQSPGPCGAQVATARQQWLDEEGDVVDDCTLILAFLDATPAPAPAPGAHADAGHGRRSIAAGASAHPPAAARRASQHSQGGAEPAHAPTASAAVSVVAVAPPHGSGGGGAAASPGLGQSKQPAAHRPPPYGAPQGHAETAASPSGVPLGAAGRASEAGAAPHAHAKRSQRLSM